MTCQKVLLLSYIPGALLQASAVQYVTSLSNTRILTPLTFNLTLSMHLLRWGYHHHLKPSRKKPCRMEPNRKGSRISLKASPFPVSLVAKLSLLLGKFHYHRLPLNLLIMSTPNAAPQAIIPVPVNLQPSVTTVEFPTTSKMPQQEMWGSDSSISFTPVVTFGVGSLPFARRGA